MARRQNTGLPLRIEMKAGWTQISGFSVSAFQIFLPPPNSHLPPPNSKFDFDAAGFPAHTRVLATNRVNHQD